MLFATVLRRGHIDVQSLGRYVVDASSSALGERPLFIIRKEAASYLVRVRIESLLRIRVDADWFPARWK